MADTTAELIKRSYYLAQVLDPREEIEGFQAEEGLYETNRVIATWGSLPKYIPAFSIVTVSVLPNVFSYTMSTVITQGNEAHLLDANSIQYPMYFVDLQRFNTFNMALSVQSPTRPQNIFIQNDMANIATASKVILFPVPDQAYTLTMYCMLKLAQLTYSQDISNLPGFWKTGLEFEVAKKLISVYGTTPAPTFADDYEKAMSDLKAANKRDKSVQVLNEFKSYRRYGPWGTYVG